MKKRKRFPASFGFAITAILVLGTAALGRATRGPRYQTRLTTQALRLASAPWATFGAPERPLVAVFGDYQCPTCARVAAAADTTLMRLAREHVVRVAYYDFPLPQHPNAVAAAIGARCAGQAGRYAEMREALYANQERWAPHAEAARDSIFAALARRVGIDGRAWDACMRSPGLDSVIAASVQEALRIGVTSTPTFMLGNRLVSGGLRASDVEREVLGYARAADAARGHNQ